MRGHTRWPKAAERAAAEANTISTAFTMGLRWREEGPALPPATSSAAEFKAACNLFHIQYAQAITSHRLAADDRAMTSCIFKFRRIHAKQRNVMGSMRKHTYTCKHMHARTSTGWLTAPTGEEAWVQGTRQARG